MKDLVTMLRELRLEDMQDNVLGQMDMTSINQIKECFLAAGWSRPAPTNTTEDVME